MIEQLTIDTLPDIGVIGQSFAHEAEYPGGFSYEAFSAMWKPLLGANLGRISVVREGCGQVIAALGASFLPDGFSGKLTASEQFWYVMPQYRKSSAGIELFDAFEAESVRRECHKIVMVHLAKLTPERLRAFLEKRGYALVEQTFWKYLK